MQLTMPKTRHDQQSSERLSVIKPLDVDLFAQQTKWQTRKFIDVLSFLLKYFV